MAHAVRLRPARRAARRTADHVHPRAAHEAACHAAGLAIEAVLEPAAPDGVPAVLVIRARKRL